jgi:hypothetical protein
MDCARFTHGLRKVYAWFAQGFRKVCARFTHGLRKIYALFTRGLRKTAHGLRRFTLVCAEIQFMQVYA